MREKNFTTPDIGGVSDRNNPGSEDRRAGEYLSGFCRIRNRKKTGTPGRFLCECGGRGKNARVHEVRGAAGYYDYTKTPSGEEGLSTAYNVFFSIRSIFFRSQSGIPFFGQERFFRFYCYLYRVALDPFGREKFEKNVAAF
jgi:hypothetical protein